MSPGAKLGPYEILSPIGAGGMGEVWKARDTRLDRIIAIKVSEKEFSERFEREARAVAALNHPHICTLHDVGPNYLVFEYVEGQPLKGPLPVGKALEYAAQICDALDAAHSKKITHRDLKPANILVTKQGVKLLDFGLAKINQATPDKPIAVAEETVTMALTSEGQILGTLLYMSPEQLQGKEADSRSDIFSFGCVLYEMLTGKRAFDGPSAASVIGAILERQAPSVAEVAPAALDRVLKQCLEKDPENRWQSARDLKSALTLAQSPAPAAVPAIPVPSKPPWLIAGAAVLAAIALAGALVFRQGPEPPRVMRFSVPYPSETRFNLADCPAISPDGRHLAFAALQGETSVLWIRDLASLEARALPGTEGAYGPFWSPDSRTVAFFTGDKLKSVDVSGGPVATLCDCDGRDGSWGTRDTILFGTIRGIFSVPGKGGVPAMVTAAGPGEIAHERPWFLPDAHHFLYVARKLGQSTLDVADLDATDKLKSRKEIRQVQTSPASATTPGAAFVPPGFLLFLRGRTLVAQRFDPDKPRVTGEELPVAEGVTRYSVSQNGVLVHEALSATIPLTQLTWFDRSGRVQGTVDSPNAINWPAISPNGTKLAYDVVNVQAPSLDVWVQDIVRGTSSRATFGQIADFPQWSPDGSRFAFRKTDPKTGGLYLAAADGATAEQLDQPDSPVFTTSLSGARPDDWSRDGRFIAEERIDSQHLHRDVWMLPMSNGKPGKAFAFLRTPYSEGWAKFSPDGKWLAYASDETGRDEVYGQEFHPSPDGSSAAGGGKVRISNNGGSRPVWSRDGKELYYIGADRKLMAVAIPGGTTLNASTPKELFQTQIAGSIDYWFDVSRDGRFIMPIRVQQSSRTEMNVVLNWPSILKQ